MLLTSFLNPLLDSTYPSVTRPLALENIFRAGPRGIAHLSLTFDTPHRSWISSSRARKPVTVRLFGDLRSSGEPLVLYPESHLRRSGECDLITADGEPAATTSFHFGVGMRLKTLKENSISSQELDVPRRAQDNEQNRAEGVC